MKASLPALPAALILDAGELCGWESLSSRKKHRPQRPLPRDRCWPASRRELRSSLQILSSSGGTPV